MGAGLFYAFFLGGILLVIGVYCDWMAGLWRVKKDTLGFGFA